MKKDELQSALLATFTITGALALVDAGALFNILALLSGLGFGIWLLVDQYIL